MIWKGVPEPWENNYPFYPFGYYLPFSGFIILSTQPLDTYVVNVRPAKGQKPSARIHVAYSANTIRALQGVCRNGQKQSFDRPFYTIRRLLAVGPWTPSACQPCKNSESQSKRLALLYRSLSTSIVGFFNNLIFCVRCEILCSDNIVCMVAVQKLASDSN